mmetsp:Transcript_46667/g.116284  ORF Transcript_46667/g.116284 Transcript_46667/m.116284 type:complete len:340 (-) Transcript_46667:373-1392(-)
MSGYDVVPAKVLDEFLLGRAAEARHRADGRRTQQRVQRIARLLEGAFPRLLLGLCRCMELRQHEGAVVVELADQVVRPGQQILELRPADGPLLQLTPQSRHERRVGAEKILLNVAEVPGVVFVEERPELPDGEEPADGPLEASATHLSEDLVDAMLILWRVGRVEAGEEGLVNTRRIAEGLLEGLVEDLSVHVCGLGVVEAVVVERASPLAVLAHVLAQLHKVVPHVDDVGEGGHALGCEQDQQVGVLLALLDVLQALRKDRHELGPVSLLVKSESLPLMHRALPVVSVIVRHDPLDVVPQHELVALALLLGRHTGGTLGRAGRRREAQRSGRRGSGGR